MKSFLLAAILLISFTSGFSQCFPDRHNASWFDGWISCDTRTNPNPTRGESHWIEYDFGQPYSLGQLQLWNVNAPDILDYGIQSAFVDYSLDGVIWKEYGKINPAMGSGLNNYEGEMLSNLGGIEARYVVITGITSYGSDCMGFAEVKIKAEPLDIDEASCIHARVYPNPVESDQLFVQLTQQCADNINYRLLNPMGKVIINSTPIKKYETKEILSGRNLAPGIYFLILDAGFTSVEYKVIVP